MLLSANAWTEMCDIRQSDWLAGFLCQETKKIIFIFTYLKSIKGLKPTKASAVKFVNICAPVLIIILYHVKN